MGKTPHVRKTRYIVLMGNNNIIIIARNRVAHTYIIRAPYLAKRSSYGSYTSTMYVRRY